jgi:iron complex outermembrane recepter protein
MKNLTKISASSLAALAFALTTPAFAQAAADETADSGDIIVTAQKREEKLQDVPVAVSVISGTALANQGGINLENAQYLVPSLNFRKSGTSINQSLYLRGVGTATFSIAGEPSVSTVVDGVVLSRSGEAFSDLVDIERIEVLRGPQGTLFGKNTSAGVINIVSKRPTKEFGGFGEAGFAFDNGNEYRGRVGLNVPFSENVLSRFTGFYSKYDGNIFNDAPNVNRRVNGFKRYGVRGIVEADAGEALKFTLIGDWRKANDDCCAEVIGAPARNPDGSVYANFLTRAAAGLPPLRGDKTRTVRQNLVTQAIEKSWGLSLQGDLDVGDHTVTSITSYRKYDNREVRDGDFLDRAYVGIAQSHDDGPQTGKTFTQELRLTSPGNQPFEYVVGAYFSRAKTDRTFTRSNIRCTATTLATVGGGLLPCSTTLGASTIDFPVGTADFGSDFRNFALFGQATYHVTDKLNLIGGLRFTKDKLSAFHIRTVPVAGASNPPFDAGVFNNGLGGGTPNGIPFRQSVNNSNLSGKAGVQYEFSEQSTAYATYSRGYKGPAFNVFFNLNPNGTPTIDPETSNAYEVGLKNTLMDGALILNLAAYYAKYKNFQANNPDFVLNQRVTRFTNAGDVSTRGFEAEAILRPMADLSFSGGLAYTDAKVDTFRLPTGANPLDRVPDGTPLGYAPKWKISWGGDYRVRTGGFADIEFNLATSYQTKQISLFLANPLAREQGTIKAYGLVDLSVGLVDQNDRFKIAFHVKNLFDRSFAAAISDGGPLSAGIPAAPAGQQGGVSSFRYLIPREADRYFGVTARINFGGK